MKWNVFFWLCLFTLTGISDPQKELTVYSYDSFTGEGSLGDLIKARFKKKTGIETRFVTFPSSGEGLNQILLENKNTKADVLLGLDNNFLSKAVASHAFVPLKDVVKAFPHNPWFTEENHLYDSDFAWLPYDFGEIAILYQDKAGKNRGNIASFNDFAQKAKHFVFCNPKVSTLGMSLVAWVDQVLGASQAHLFWQKMKPGILSVTPGWSASYQLFMKGEADYVLSYTTSPAYHIEKEKRHDVKALTFHKVPSFSQVEFVGVPKESKHVEWAKQWVAFLLSEEIQKEVPMTQWMYPVSESVVLPKSFPKIDKKQIVKTTVLSDDKRKELVTQWENATK